jgi:type VI secretion system secreted protein VgrG
MLRLIHESLPTLTKALSVRGTEAMNELSRFDVVISVPAPDLVAEELLATRADLALDDEGEGSTRLVPLLITDVRYLGSQLVAVRGDGDPDAVPHQYEITLAPAAWVLTARSGFSTFIEKSVPEIVGEVLEAAGIPADQIAWRLAGTYPKRRYTVQYGETDWAFVKRLLADEGINLWFDATDDGAPLMMFGDDSGSHEGVPRSVVLPFADNRGMVSGRHFFELALTHTVTTAKTHVRDYDVRAPDVYIEGRAGDDGAEYFEYPAHVDSSEDATRRATVRLSQLQRFQALATGKSNCVRLSPGRVVEVEGATDDWINGQYLVVGLEHDGQARSTSDAASYENQAVLVPVGDTPFRPAIPVDAPRVASVETAITTGPSGEEIHVDDLGRVKLKLPWDRSEARDDTTSYWVRCLQLSVGNAMFLPRVGWEVPVAYVDGDPDRPFVLGRLYNATAVVPYGLPGAVATATLQSATSPGGGTTNEIRFGDSGGGEELFIHASRDQTVTVGGASTTSVDVNETLDVGLGLRIGIDGAQSLTVAANRKEDVAMEHGTNVEGSRTEIIGGMELQKITGNRIVAVGGAYTELIGGLYGIQCNQSNTTVAGAFMQMVGGSMNIAAGLGAGENVAAARTMMVGGARSITAAKEHADKVTGAKNVTSGSVTENAAGAYSLEVAGAGTITVGGSADLKGGGKLTVTAPSMTVTVGGSIKAGKLKIGGGKVQVSGGKTKVQASTIKRSGGAELK